MNILIGITGSIAAYKTPDIARALVTRGHKVKVVCSNGAAKFINPEVFKHLGVEATYKDSDDFDHKGVLHIDLARWADQFVILPLSANYLSKLAHGRAEGLLDSLFLSLDPSIPKVLVPAMNTKMYQNPITQENLKTLKKLKNIEIINPDSGFLACGEQGEGKMPSVESLVEVLPLLLSKKVNKKVIVTAGATLSSIDPVRYVTNPAKGGSGYLIAKKYLQEGYDVHVIRGQDSLKEFLFLKKHPNYTETVVITTNDLLTAVKKDLDSCDIYISPMAVSDIECEYVDSKLKKSSMNGAFKFNHAVDVLKYVIENKNTSTKVVGFAAETSLDQSVLDEKLKRKPVDLLVANFASSGFQSGKKQGFGTKDGHYKLVSNGNVEEIENLNKQDLADYIFKKIN